MFPCVFFALPMGWPQYLGQDPFKLASVCELHLYAMVLKSSEKSTIAAGRVPSHQRFAEHQIRGNIGDILHHTNTRADVDFGETVLQCNPDQDSHSACIRWFLYLINDRRKIRIKTI